MAFLVNLVYNTLNKSYPNLETTEMGAELNFHSFYTPLDSVASKLKECIGMHEHTHMSAHTD